MSIASIPKNPVAIPEIAWQDQSNGDTSILSLEIFYCILTHACREPKDVAQVSLVCKLWRTATNSSYFWKTIAISYPDITLNPDIYPKEQIQALFQKVKETNYPTEVLKIFGGINRLAQIPTVVLPSDYKKSDFEIYFNKEYQGRNPITKFFGSYGRPAFGIRYIHNQALSNARRPAGRYEGMLLLFKRFKKDKKVWTFYDTLNPELYLEACWLWSTNCIEWLQKLVSGSPCPKRSIIKSTGQILETPVLNADNKPFYQLWNPTDPLFA